MTLLLLCAFSLLAGFIDAVVGGGGLIQLPAVLILMPSIALPTVLGTNKFASFFGTTMAVQRYAR
ncbi:MAG: TSUP family transporter, partial [Chthoniobacterales bacterium]|nr:TSUP family transporter [Chthoniobacterales bacterium]